MEYLSALLALILVNIADYVLLSKLLDRGIGIKSNVTSYVVDKFGMRGLAGAKALMLGVVALIGYKLEIFFILVALALYSVRVVQNGRLLYVLRKG